VEQLKSSETSMKNLFYREQEALQVLELDYCRCGMWSRH
jgi:hypothetical protein